MPKANKKKRPLLNKILVVLLMAAVVVMLVKVLSAASFLQIKQINVIGDTKNVVSGEIKSELTGQNILFFSHSQIEKDALKTPLVSQLAFESLFPSTVVVQVSYRQPVVAWQSSNGLFVVDKDGVIFDSVGTSSLPQVSDSASPGHIGDKVTSSKFNLDYTIVQKFDPDFTVLTIDNQPTQVNLVISGGTQVLLSNQTDLTSEHQALQLIIAKDKIEGKVPRIIDLRFANPVVTY